MLLSHVPMAVPMAYVLLRRQNPNAARQIPAPILAKPVKTAPVSTKSPNLNAAMTDHAKTHQSNASMVNASIKPPIRNAVTPNRAKTHPNNASKAHVLKFPNLFAAKRIPALKKKAASTANASR